MRHLVILSLIAMAACQPQPTPLEDAKARYGYLKRNGASASDLCRAAGDVKAALVEAQGSEAEFLSWKLTEEKHCQWGEAD